jgi:ArsR family metal-binding transcriptional regulator
MPTDYQIAITRPCRDAPGRFTAESSYGRRLDMTAICAGTKNFPEAKCSESLGVAKFDYGEHTVILYRSGRIDLRRVKDVADAQAVMAELERALAGAFESEDNVHLNVKA